MVGLCPLQSKRPQRKAYQLLRPKILGALIPKLFPPADIRDAVPTSLLRPCVQPCSLTPHRLGPRGVPVTKLHSLIRHAETRARGCRRH